ncbi:ABC transporter substrate-binding protein [Ohessyouella blattaphilus]|uniref:Extracellular solute-binding protein n=1 Tax=Ohessyouella blattaphilus TaxID=2949333 RepID=A0ABT1EKP9_9FIRM|nr:extracellular solute-binding protein [Ohessyouella blattaphilus]MCP1111281.1 extracellular solute-binding protein [Ohessyouella blattaphilus]MCR8564675.1 extracellular solute-binding protein [Ohessyouella blattaphilus]MDL2249722.1 extracellular solute-binding protein [Lachnospiraceae bacterium OttesenSCG-928-J05]
MKRKVLALFLVGAMVSSFVVGCGKSDGTDSGSQSESEKNEDIVTLKYATYRVGNHPSAAQEKACLDRFEELYGDEIKLEIEELPSDQAYADKMKVLAASGELPDVVDGKNGIKELAIDNGQAVDILPMLEDDQEWKADLSEDAIQANMSEDGKLYSLVALTQLSGYFYNTEMFADAGIEPAKTWEEFMDNCEKLDAKGHTPLALMTGENCWATNILLAAMIGTNGEAGNEFMNTKYPDTYQTPEVIDALERMKVLLEKYTTEDAIGALYANAANNFMQGEAAMFCNGLWMTPDFENPEKSMEGFSDKVGIAMFPENGLMTTYPEGWVVCADSPEKQDAAMKLLKVFTDAEGQQAAMEYTKDVPCGNNVEITDQFAAENPLFAQMMEDRKGTEYAFATFDVTAYPTVVDSFSKYYPDLVYGNITAEEMAKKLDEAAESSK